MGALDLGDYEHWSDLVGVARALRIDACRASQKAPAEAPSATLPDFQGAVVPDRANGATGTTEGSTTGWRDPNCPAATDKNRECICHLTDPAKAKPQPRVWHSGDPEPGPEVKAVRDVLTRWWEHRQHGGIGQFRWYHEPEDRWAAWEFLISEYGEVTDASDEVA